MSDLEQLSRQAYTEFVRQSNGFGGMSWQDLSMQTKTAWKAAIALVLQNASQQVTAEIPPPLFAPLDTFDLAKLQMFREGWRRLQRDPQWAFWHNHAPDAIAAIEAEIQRRSDSGSQM